MNARPVPAFRTKRQPWTMRSPSCSSRSSDSRWLGSTHRSAAAHPVIDAPNATPAGAYLASASSVGSMRFLRTGCPGARIGRSGYSNRSPCDSESLWGLSTRLSHATSSSPGQRRSVGCSSRFDNAVRHVGDPVARVDDAAASGRELLPRGVMAMSRAYQVESKILREFAKEALLNEGARLRPPRGGVVIPVHARGADTLAGRGCSE